LSPPLGGDPLEFGDEIWRQKTRDLQLPSSEESSFLHFDKIPASDGQTDRQTR